MRLTLRTLLAYTDDILDPADHDDLGRKIEASDFATELIHRTRDTVRRLRLGAPDVFAGQADDILESISVADANAVAEYLDNTLPAHDVADFERMCLEPGSEADMHLAEVASCHHVLTMVLGEPAEIDVDVRRRMYQLPSQPSGNPPAPNEPAHLPVDQEPPADVQSAAVHAEVPAAILSMPPPVAPPPPAAEAEVPDYLRAAAAHRQRKKHWIAATVLLALAAGIAGFFLPAVFMAPELPEELADSDLGAISSAPTIPSVGQSGSLPGEGQLGSTAANEEAPPFVSEVPVEQTEVPPSNAPPATTAPESDPAATTAPLDQQTGQSRREPATGADLPDEVVSDLPEVSDLPGTEPGESAAASRGESSVRLPGPGPEVSPDDLEMADSELTVDDSTAGVLIEGVEVAESDPELPQPLEPEGPPQLGNYLGNNDVLLRYDPSQDKWIRLPPRSALSAGDSLLALPKFRPHVVLGDVNIYLSGGTRLDLPMADAALGAGEVDLELAVVFGRVLLNAGLQGRTLGLQVGDQMRQVQLAGSTSLAVQVQRVFIPGSDNEQQSSPVEAVWYLTSGSLQWPGPAGEPQSIEGPATWKTVAGIDDLPQLISTLPEWIDREPMTDLQRRARDTMLDELSPGQPVGLTLMELNDQREKGRRQEVRTLAAESSVFIGQFEPFVKALSDKAQRRAWDSHIRTLRQALALSPEVAARVRDAFVEARGGPAAGDLMEMIAGYSSAAIGETREEIQQGALVELIRWLEHDSLDYRVLAIYNLNEITGATSLKSFRPDDSSRGRRIAVAKIRKSLESNELLPQP